MTRTRAGRPCHAVGLGLALGSLLLIGCTASSRDRSTPIPTAGPAASRPVAALNEVINGFEIDERLTLCQITEQPGRKLSGFVEMPQHREVLKGNGFDVSGVKLLPEESNTDDRFGIVTAEHAIVRKSPKDELGERENVTDLTKGEFVWILDRQENGWVLVHSSDGYLGWAPPATVESTEPEQAAATARKPSALSTKSARPGSEDDPLTKLDETQQVEREAQERKAELLRHRVLVAADTFLRTPYVWGGKTSEGIDCSGLVQTSFARHGILLPRDADQQANVGRLVATRYFSDALQPGDLLFFMSSRRGNISHVAIYKGDGKYIEAAGPDVHVRSMKPSDSDYDERRTKSFAWARRVIE
jgi:cell wall-associated NlpC family hydrolase